MSYWSYATQSTVNPGAVGEVTAPGWSTGQIIYWGWTNGGSVYGARGRGYWCRYCRRWWIRTPLYLISDEKARWKTTFTQKWCAPCQVDSEKTKTFYQEFHRRHAFESLPVTLVYVKIEITLDCRNQIVTRSKLSEIVHFGFENCCNIVRSKRANKVRPYGLQNELFRRFHAAVAASVRRGRRTLQAAILHP